MSQDDTTRAGDRRRPRLDKAARHERILSEMRTCATLRVGDLAADLEVSTETIRRDLFELQEKGLINRTYGGAVRPFGDEPAVTERHRLMVAEREAIAAVTVKFIQPKEVIAIGAGATTTHVARRMSAECRDITVITHSFSVATVLAPNPTIEIIMCPGRYNAREGMMVGAETIDFLQNYNVNRAILGISGITTDGLADAEAPAAWVYKAMMNRAAETIVVSDHKKFDVQALAIWARIPDIQRLVVDAAPAGTVARALERAHVDVTVARK
ncbi:DeoR/GlpR family DNA-binding transcription regulator [Ancylobacter amanitiformis]|uniref:DeoR/GlpR family transcriptional regulator of sugar metabolism n=1 Tax=Ancylobacter amanitiformis TaxID=217069 RepID=A0ABU0LU67_9HYPH|nr:DeoR/GlpR family DNA-binding transcription regulator [Ancylobacter amanitiformis]MDQ0512190.1 DeoR/GlpR family transcriptional regulator of sugar metabolism [Ancylobacter amanitiformis]